MTEQARREYAEAMRRRCDVATRVERGHLLDGYFRIAGCHRKAAIRRLPQTSDGGGRPCRYGRDLLPGAREGVEGQRLSVRQAVGPRRADAAAGARNPPRRHRGGASARAAAGGESGHVDRYAC